MARTALYWLFSLVALTLLLVCWRVLTGQPKLFTAHLADLWNDYSPALIGSLLLLPLIAIDSVRLSNRFAGPMYRLRRGIRQLADGEPAELIFFRAGDFWQDFADDYNRLVRRVEKLQQLADLESAGGTSNQATAN